MGSILIDITSYFLPKRCKKQDLSLHQQNTFRTFAEDSSMRKDPQQRRLKESTMVAIPKAKYPSAKVTLIYL